MTTAAIYARISKDDRDDRLGVERQEKLCRQLAERLGLDVEAVLVDNDISAYNGAKRAGWDALLDLIEVGAVGAIVTYHVDRLYRRTTDLERLVCAVEANDVQVHTVAAGDIDLSSASGRMVARMLGAAAQGESERMSERLRAKTDELAAAGKPPGGRPPYGYSKGYVVNRDEAKTVRLIARKVLAGQSLLSIGRELDEKGHRTREGRPWHVSTVRAVVVNPAVAGLRVHRREIAGPGVWKPILDRATWDDVQSVLGDPARRRRKPVAKYPLTGLVFSPAGDPMTGRPDRGAGGSYDRRTYATRTPAQHPMAVDANELEAAVAEMVFDALDDATIPAPEPDNDRADDVVRLEQEMAELAKLRGEGSISMPEWLAARKPLQERLDAARAAAGRPVRSPALDRLVGRPGAVRKAWSTLDAETQRSIVALVMEQVVIGPAFRARWTTIEERLDPDKGFGPVWRA